MSGSGDRGGVFGLPLRRPVAVSMVFAGIVLLGLIGWRKIPVELVPPLTGDQIYVSFARPGSEPEVVEREILLPLEARVSELAGVEETWGEVGAATGTFRVRFSPGVDLKVRELDLRRLAAEIVRGQPEGTTVRVQAQDFSAASRFVMLIEVVGGDDRHALRSFVDELIEPRLAAVSGVSQIIVSGGGAREVTVRVDPDRCAALGILPTQVVAALQRSVGRLRFVGGSEDEAGRTLVVLDGRPAGLYSLGEVRVAAEGPVLLRHVAELEAGAGREEILFRTNGRFSVGLVVFQDEGANLVELGRRLRARLDELSQEAAAYGIEFEIGSDAAELVERQLERLKQLAVWGFAIALVVLLLFLRQLRAVAVVAVAVPVSLLAAVAMLYVGGLTLNLITLFGLAVGIGMLVDNSIVVYEAVQRRLERGVAPDAATAGGVRRTVRAITAASVTTAAVFLPVVFTTEEAVTRGILKLIALAILLPLGASIVVAVGLVPLLARRLAAPAALARIATLKARREAYAGLVRPDRGRELFTALVKVALRRPAGWLAGVAAAVLLTVLVALPWVSVTTLGREAPEADEIRLAVDIEGRGSLDASAEVFTRLEQAALELEGVESVESIIQEESGSLTVRLVDRDARPLGLSAARVRRVVRHEAEELDGVEIRDPDGGGGSGGEGAGGLLGQGPAEVLVSGPETARLRDLAVEIEQRLESVPEIGSQGAWTGGRSGMDEIRVVPDSLALTAHGLTADQVLPALGVVRREGVRLQTGFTLADGREIPLVVRSPEGHYVRAGEEIGRLRVSTPAGVMPVGAVAEVRRMPPPPTILHHNGRREVSVFYRFGSGAPQTGPARQELDEQVVAVVREAHRPSGYTVEARGEERSTGWFKRSVVPVLLLLFAVLAITFESLTLPVVVLLAVPLTVLGATWALVLAGMPADLMALVGAVALLGLTVNPAILLVDRMQHRVLHGSWTPGAAALAAVRERARPVLMTSCTTIAGLWPLALATGRENEIWPPFATVVMGGLATSTLLTLLVIPVGFVLLHRLDEVLGRLGPWLVLAWVGATTAVMAPLIVSDQITTLTWQVVTTMLVAGLLLAAAVLVFGRRERPQPTADGGPPAVEVRLLHKIYGRPGPVGRAWRSGTSFAERVLARGGTPFVPREAWEHALTLTLLVAGAGYLALQLRSVFWQLIFSFVAAGLAARLLREVRRGRGRCDVLGRVEPGGVEGWLAVIAPWVALAALAMHYCLLPTLAEERVRIVPLAVLLLCVVVAVVQLGRRTAVQLAREAIEERPVGVRWSRLRALWRRLSRRVFGLDLPLEEIVGLAGVSFRAEGGMVGVLGPNGAGKTTLLRLLAGILEPTVGNATLGDVAVARLRRQLARWVGYLPQDFGLPVDLSAREYLEYYALLYRTGGGEDRRDRVQSLLEEVGLGDRADDRIGAYSGGMRQRVAVARTLLRLPPVIIVDEPTVGLDPRERVRFRNLLARLAKGRVVLFSTHVVEDVAVACTRVVVLARGEIVFDGEPGRLAEAARGQVWEVHLVPGEEGQLPDEARVIDQVPEEDGRSRARVLCAGSPHADAVPIDPTLEDGYLCLVGRARDGGDEEESAA